MGEHTEIAWTDHTFNPWEGCARVSPGCEQCYAEARNARFHRDEDRTRMRRESTGNRAPVATHWGVAAPRLKRSESYWKEPVKWNAAARRDGVQRRVFCASLADVFEDREDLVEPRLRLLRLIEECDSLDWLLLTKRPQNMVRLAHVAWGGAWPPNVWAGTTAEDQERLDKRIHWLLDVPARVHFLSVEPIIGEVDLTKCGRGGLLNALNGAGFRTSIDWVIVGGESGPGARPCDVAAVRRIVEDCRAAGVAAFVKQLGASPTEAPGLVELRLRHKKGGEPAEWPEELRVRMLPGEAWS